MPGLSTEQRFKGSDRGLLLLSIMMMRGWTGLKPAGQPFGLSLIHPSLLTKPVPPSTFQFSFTFLSSSSTHIRLSVVCRGHIWDLEGDSQASTATSNMPLPLAGQGETCFFLSPVNFISCLHGQTSNTLTCLMACLCSDFLCSPPALSQLHSGGPLSTPRIWVGIASGCITRPNPLFLLACLILAHRRGNSARENPWWQKHPSGCHASFLSSCVV